jgi:hypothetical protein
MPQRPISVPVLALVAAFTAAAADYRISGPYTHENLTVYLLHGESRATDKPLLTLREAIDQKKVVVYETGTVSQLSIENTSDTDVYIQGGDIVKGGKQDRVLVTDLVLPAYSGRVPIKSFCVEQGRWQKRGAEADDRFNASSRMVAGKNLKLAVREKKQQTEVWNQVAALRMGLANSTERFDRTDRAPVPSASVSSMQLALEAKAVVNATRPYLDALEKIAAPQHDAIGFAYAVNGALESADVYLSHDLFMRMWPKLLQAGAAEAVADRPKWRAETPVADREAVARLLAARNGEGVMVMETHDRDDSALLHRNYLVK